MYDPLVVDTFIASYAEISPAAIKAGQDARSMMDGTGLSASQTDEPAPFKQIRANASEAALLNSCEHDISQATSAIEAMQVSAQCLRQLTPATVYALFTYDLRTDLLTCTQAVGDVQGLLQGLKIRLGERVTGWTAANLRTSLNSDPRLDLTQIADFFSPPLRSTLSTPLLRDQRLVAVLTAYSTRAEAFTDAHRYTVEQVASTLRDRLVSLVAPESHSVVSFPQHRN
jgi:putative methionine-R-sulfoxide reductase with GAF domain